MSFSSRLKLMSGAFFLICGGVLAGVALNESLNHELKDTEGDTKPDTGNDDMLLSDTKCRYCDIEIRSYAKDARKGDFDLIFNESLDGHAIAREAFGAKSMDDANGILTGALAHRFFSAVRSTAIAPFISDTAVFGEERDSLCFACDSPKTLYLRGESKITASLMGRDLTLTSITAPPTHFNNKECKRKLSFSRGSQKVVIIDDSAYHLLTITGGQI